MTEIAPSRVVEIIDHERQADQLAAASDAHRWEAARLIADELDAGKSQRQLAAEIGKSQTHVSFMARTWRDYQGNQLRPAFAEAYQALKARHATVAIGPAKAQPKATQEEAEQRTEAIRAQLAVVWDELTWSVGAGIDPLAIVGAIVDAWRDFEALSGMAPEDAAVVRRDLVDPQIAFALGLEGTR